jgi:hypothetical protein
MDSLFFFFSSTKSQAAFSAKIFDLQYADGCLSTSGQSDSSMNL